MIEMLSLLARSSDKASVTSFSTNSAWFGIGKENSLGALDRRIRAGGRRLA